MLVTSYPKLSANHWMSQAYTVFVPPTNKLDDIDPGANDEIESNPSSGRNLHPRVCPISSSSSSPSLASKDMAENAPQQNDSHPPIRLKDDDDDDDDSSSSSSKLNAGNTLSKKSPTNTSLAFSRIFSIPLTPLRTASAAAGWDCSTQHSRPSARSRPGFDVSRAAHPNDDDDDPSNSIPSISVLSLKGLSNVTMAVSDLIDRMSRTPFLNSSTFAEDKSVRKWAALLRSVAMSQSNEPR
mmetsp:Transcript_3384/g.7570  ORF Transcript_3384/g.7570 Transcript_3384/m.7570 type:complete len:240 (-) Transcript_3384:373-1092(-)